MIRPKLLLLDEPSLGLSPVMMERVLGEVAEINRKGVTVLLVEQRVKAALTVAKTVSVLRLGTIVQEGTKSDAADPKWLADAIYGSTNRCRCRPSWEAACRTSGNKGGDWTMKKAIAIVQCRRFGVGDVVRIGRRGRGAGH